MQIELILIQKKISQGNLNEKLEYLEKLVRNLPPSANNKLFLLPELWLSGFNRENLFYFTSHFQDIIHNLKNFCKRFNVNLAGTFSEFSDSESKKFYNSLIFISSEGNISSNYRKMHLFPLTNEKDYFMEGTSPIILNFHGINIGFAICYDIRFPELFRYYAKKQVKLILVSACFPKPRLKDWQTLLKCRAIENQFFVAATNSVGSELVNKKKVTYFGHSLLIDPVGKILAELKNKEDTKSIIIDTEEVTKAKKIIDYINDIRNI